MPVARIVGGVGRVLITAGLVLLLFVAYQLWGTGLAEARAQDDLKEDFAAALAATPTSAPPTTGAPADGQPATTAPVTTAPVTTAVTAPAPRPPEGEAVAIIRIPRLGLEKAVVEGVSVGDLEKGPGHYPATPMPGEVGNAAIAGHRTTYGAPFGDLGELVAGDEILVTTRAGEFRYVVDRTSIVSPSQVEVLDPTPEARLTLTTCHPKYTARQRLIVSGVLAGPPPAPAAPTAPAAEDSVTGDDAATGDDGVTGDGEPAGTVPGEDLPGEDLPGDGVPGSAEGDEGAAVGDGGGAAPAAGSASLDDPSLAGDPSARGPAAAWAGLTALVALVAWAVGRRWRRWPAYLLALPLGAVALFQCFEQVARLMPANV